MFGSLGGGTFPLQRYIDNKARWPKPGGQTDWIPALLVGLRINI